VVVGALLVFASGVGWDNVYVGIIPYTAGAALNDLTLAGFVLLIYGLLGDAPRLFERVLTLPPLQLVGMMCYSLFLWHMVGMHPWEPESWRLRDMPAHLLFTFVVAALTYRFIEFRDRPVRDLFWAFPSSLPREPVSALAGSAPRPQ
jgi:peptidoglycan/LPS O-acetylase OafA/YrhL